MIDSPRNPAALQIEIRRTTAAGGWRGELWNRRKDRSDFPIALTTSQIRDPQGRATMSVIGKSQRLDVVFGPNYRAAVIWAGSWLSRSARALAGLFATTSKT